MLDSWAGAGHILLSMITLQGGMGGGGGGGGQGVRQLGWCWTHLAEHAYFTGGWGGGGSVLDSWTGAGFVLLA